MSLFPRLVIVLALGAALLSWSGLAWRTPPAQPDPGLSAAR